MSRALAICLLLCGFAAAPEEKRDSSSCLLWDVTDQPVDGLVIVEEPLLSTLRSLVPELAASTDKMCWYQRPSGHLEARYLVACELGGYEFEKTETGWRFLTKHMYDVFCDDARVR